MEYNSHKVKYVFSKSQTYPEENVHVIGEDISKTVNQLKQESTKIYGYMVVQA